MVTLFVGLCCKSTFAAPTEFFDTVTWAVNGHTRHKQTPDYLTRAEVVVSTLPNPVKIEFGLLIVFGGDQRQLFLICS